MVSSRQTFVNLARLQNQLNVAGLQQSNPPLYQVISQLISAQQQIQSVISGNIASISQAPIISAGTSSRQLSSIVFSNSNGISFGLNQSTITGSFGLALSASATSFNVSKLTFANSNGITFGLSANSVITASHNGITGIAISAGASSANLSSVIFSNSNGVSFGLSGSTVTASIANAGVTFSAGTSTAQLNSVVFNNANGVTFGLNGSTITASVIVPSGQITSSYFENLPAFQNTAVVATNNASEMFIQPINIPNYVSASYFRNIVSQSFQNNASFGLTSANTDFSASHFFTHAWVLYTLNTGASSNSLVSINSSSYGRTLASAIHNGTAGSQFTISMWISYNALGKTDSTFSVTTNFSNASYLYTTGPVSDFQGAIYFDSPFLGSLSPGQYFLGQGMSTTSSNNGPSGAFSAGSAGFSSIMNSQITNTPKVQGTNIVQQLQPGLGRYTTNSAFMTTSGFDISNIITRPSNNVNLVQMIYRN